MAANNSYEQAVSLIAAANRVVQDPNSVGAALRTISLRLRGTSVKELEEAGEDTTGAVESSSKLRGKVKSLSGVDILTNTGAYKDTYTILLEISKVWEDMSDIDQAALLELLAGKTRSNTLAAILGNTKDLEEAYESAMNAEGSALAENEKYLDSIQGKIDQFNNAVQTMWSNTLNSGLVKFIVDAGTALIKVVDNLGLVKTLIIAIGTYLMQKHFKGDFLGGFFGIGTKEGTEKKSDAQRIKDWWKNRNKQKNDISTKPQTNQQYDSSIEPPTADYNELENKLKSLKDTRQSLVDDLDNSQQYEDFLGSRMAAGYDDAAEAIDRVHIRTEKLKGQINQVDQEIVDTDTQLKNVGVSPTASKNTALDHTTPISNKVSQDQIHKRLAGVQTDDFMDFSEDTISDLVNSVDDLTEARDKAQKALDKRPKSKKRQQKLNSIQEELDVESASLTYAEKSHDLKELKQQRKALKKELAATNQEISDMWSSGEYGESGEDFDKLSAKAKDLQAQLDANKTAIKDTKKSLGEVGTSGSDNLNDVKTGAQDAQQGVQDVKESVDGAKQSLDQAGNSGKQAGHNIGQGADKAKTKWQSFKKSLGQVLASFATMYAISTAFELINKGIEGVVNYFDNLSTSPEEAYEKFEELNSELSSTESELKSLESELDSTNERIDELLEKDSLTLVEQEELENLQSATKELERQIQVNKTLQKQKQNAVNDASLKAMSLYSTQTSFYSDKSKSERQQEAKENGETWGSAAGMALGAVIGSFIPGGTLIGAGIGAALGSIVGSWVGSNSEGSAYDSELTVDEAIDRMPTIRAKLQQEVNKAREDINNSDKPTKKQEEALRDAEKALGDFDVAMGQSISQMQEYINAIDYSTLTDENDKLKYIEALDDILKYNVEYGLAGAKSNAIDTIFSEELISDDLQKLQDEIQISLRAGEDIDWTDFEGEEFEKARERLGFLGITVDNVINRFKELQETAASALIIDTEDVVSEIANVASGINELKQAFDEFNESGLVTAETLKKLNETFGGLDGWKDYITMMASGVSSTQEAINVTNQLVEDYLMDKLKNPFTLGEDNPLTEENERLEGYQAYITAISQLQNLGVANATELMGGIQEKAVIQAVANQIKKDADDMNALIEKQKQGTELTTEETEYLAKLQKKTQQDYIDDAKKKYGIEVKNTEIISQQIDLLKTEDKLKSYRKYDSQFFDQNSLSDQYNDAKTKYDIASSSYEELLQDIEDREAKNNNVSEIEKFFLSFVSDEHLNDLYNKADDQQLIMTQKMDEAQQSFTELQDIAKELNIDLSDIDIDSFNLDDGWDDSDTEIYEQVFNRVNTEVDKTIEELEKKEEELKKKLDTAFTELGLEVTLELFDKSKLIDDIQSVYDALKNAQKEYAESGYLSVDTMQTLLGLKPKYLALLMDENGNLNLNEEALYKVAEARIADMGIAQQNAIIEQALELATNGSRDALLEYTEATYGAVAATDSLVSSQLALLKTTLTNRTQDQTEEVKRQVRGADGEIREETVKVVTKADLSEEEAEQIYNDTVKAIDAVAAVTQAGIDGVRKGGLSAGSSDGESALEALLKRYERKISNLDNQQTYIQNEIDRLEAEDAGISKQYYEKQIAIEEQKMDLYEQQKSELSDLLNSTAEGSDEWWETAEALWDVEHALQESTIQAIEFRKSIVELYEIAFEKLGAGFGNKDALLDDSKAYLEGYMELLELQGELAHPDMYKELINQEELDKANNQSLLAAQEALYQQGIKSGTLDPNSEAAIQMQADMRATEQAIQDNDKAIAQFNEDLENLYIEGWDKVVEAFDNKDFFFEKQQGFVESYIDRLEKMNINVPDTAYDKLIEIQKMRNKTNRDELDWAYKELGRLKEEVGEDDPKYIDKLKEVTEKEEELYNGETQVMEWQKQILDNRLDRFNQVIDRINNAIDELDNISGLFDRDDVAAEDGTWTRSGTARLGIAVEQMEYNKGIIAKYNDEIAYYDELLRTNQITEKEHAEKTQELKDGQWDAINAYESAKDSIIDLNEARIDMIEEGINKEIEAYQELIDLKKEELDAERDLYNFRKDIQKQTKDISALERRLASMSGSTDATTIAERSKLEKELREAKESLDDSYYNHAMDSMSTALDDELKAYEDDKNDYIESLRESIKNTDALIESTYARVMQSSNKVLQYINDKVAEYGVPISSYITSPWESGKKSADGFKGAVDNNIGSIKNIVETSASELEADLSAPYDKVGDPENGAVVTFSEHVLEQLGKIVDDAKGTQEGQYGTLPEHLSAPWDEAKGVVASWKDSTLGALDEAIVKAKEYGSTIESAGNTNTPSYTTNQNSGSGNSNTSQKPSSTSNFGSAYNADVKTLQDILVNVFGIKLPKYGRDGKYGGPGGETWEAVRKMQNQLKVAANGEYNEATSKALKKHLENMINVALSNDYPQDADIFRKYSKIVPPAMFAKGTLGTTRDQLAITDESWIGEEITLAAGKNGQLQYLKKGSAVMPADISANLVEWGKLNPNMMNTSGVVDGINLMSNYINKPELKLDIENFLKVDRVDKDTLPELEKLMDKKIDTFAKQLNYSLKKFK